MTDELPAGKLPEALLSAFLAGIAPSPHVLVGPRVGEDAAVLDVGGRYLVLAMDPVTLSADPAGLAVQINANDIAVSGGEARWLLATVLLPIGTTTDAATALLGRLRDACLDLGVALIGGHTEVTPAVTAPVVAACMIGEVRPERLVRTGGAQVGDAILLAGPIAVEGTGILAREWSRDLICRGVPADVIASAAQLLDHPGISVVPAVRALMSAVQPHALHDPTEGGLLGGAAEIALASDVGVRIDGPVPVLPQTDIICAALGLNPLGLLASGSLLAALAPSDVENALDALMKAGIWAAVIGQVTGEGLTMGIGETPVPFSAPQRDELARWIEAARGETGGRGPNRAGGQVVLR